jgi:hypothetical protein
VEAGGCITMWRLEAFNHRVVSRARLTLPEHARASSFQWALSDCGEKLALSWGAGVGLQVTPAASTSRHDKHWAQGLFDGFHLEYTVQHAPHTGGDMAELLVDMETSGWWFGGSHLMRQHWPLNTGSWEVSARTRTIRKRVCVCVCV